MVRLNIVIPMAGKGQRFIDAGYTIPKVLIELGGELIIKHIIETMRVKDCQFIFIVRKDHCERYGLDKKILELEPHAKVVKISELSQGSICTVLSAKEYFDDKYLDEDIPVIIKDCDQIINWDPEHFLELVTRRNAEGAVVTIHTENPHYSFSRLNSNGEVIETAEKSVISNNGHVGIYYFSSGTNLITYAERMIKKNIRVNNEFYTAPVYNQMIQDGKIILCYPVAEMFQLGTPQDLENNKEKTIRFLKSRKILKDF